MAQLANLMKNSTHADVKAEAAGALWSLSEDADIKVRHVARTPPDLIGPHRTPSDPL